MDVPWTRACMSFRGQKFMGAFAKMPKLSGIRAQVRLSARTYFLSARTSSFLHALPPFCTHFLHRTERTSSQTRKMKLARISLPNTANRAYMTGLSTEICLSSLSASDVKCICNGTTILLLPGFLQLSRHHARTSHIRAYLGLQVRGTHSGT